MLLKAITAIAEIILTGQVVPALAQQASVNKIHFTGVGKPITRNRYYRANISFVG